MTRLLAIASLALLAGCSAAGLDPSDIDDTDFQDTDVPIDTGDTGGLPQLEGDWIGISGFLDIEDGTPVADSILDIEVQVTDEQGVITPVDCTAFLVGPTDSVPQAPDSVELFGNWRFDVQPGDCVGLSDSLELGIGPLDPALWPAAEQAGASLKHSRGLYTANEGRTGLLVFGIAGTSEQIAGQGTPTTLDPLPDGRYYLKSAYLLAL